MPSSRVANGKAVGPDRVSVELFNITPNSNAALYWKLLDVVVCIWIGGEVPKQWKYVIIMAIHKTKDRTECGTYRGISLVAHAGNILLNTIAHRLNEYCNRVGVLPEEHNDFRLKLSTNRYDVRDSSATGAGAEETNSIVYILYRPYQSLRLC